MYDEIYHGNWWKRVEKTLPPHSTLMPVLLFSDETHLTNNGDVKAYPIVISSANLPRSVRNKKGNLKLAAYIPFLRFTKAEQIADPVRIQNLKLELLHKCLDILFQPFIQRQTDGEAVCSRKCVFRNSDQQVQFADGRASVLYPRVACYISDHIEAAKLALVDQTWCHICLTPWQLPSTTCLLIFFLDNLTWTSMPFERQLLMRNSEIFALGVRRSSEIVKLPITS
eukprot:Pompholyxophrys_punicea_v1_NODE_904_length_1152_cov_23.420237.p1 type:complete len:226 gc:universal NODE_904_length_1152_cov_23.420237:958-281(-)